MACTTSSCCSKLPSCGTRSPPHGVLAGPSRAQQLRHLQRHLSRPGAAQRLVTSARLALCMTASSDPFCQAQPILSGPFCQADSGCQTFLDGAGDLYSTGPSPPPPRRCMRISISAGLGIGGDRETHPLPGYFLQGHLMSFFRKFTNRATLQLAAEPVVCLSGVHLSELGELLLGISAAARCGREEEAASNSGELRDCRLGGHR